MCADPKMLRLLAAEVRGELAARRAVRGSGQAPRRWRVAAFALTAPALCLAIALAALTR